MTRMCAACGGEANRFGKYAMCTKCVDKAIELYIKTKKPWKKAYLGKRFNSRGQ